MLPTGTNARCPRQRRPMTGSAKWRPCGKSGTKSTQWPCPKEQQRWLKTHCQRLVHNIKRVIETQVSTSCPVMVSNSWKKNERLTYGIHTTGRQFCHSQSCTIHWPKLVYHISLRTRKLNEMLRVREGGRLTELHRVVSSAPNTPAHFKPLNNGDRVYSQCNTPWAEDSAKSTATALHKKTKQKKSHRWHLSTLDTSGLKTPAKKLL